MLRVVKQIGISGPDVLLDDLPASKYVGTMDQVRSIEKLLRANKCKKVILVVQPQQLPRALKLFTKLIPDVEFHPANPKEEYDAQSTQVRMHSAWRFRLWNMIAWSGIWQKE